MAWDRARGSPHGRHRTRDSYLQAQYQRPKPRLGHGRARGAVKHSMLIAYWHTFTTGQTYHDLGGDCFQRRDPERATKRLIAMLPGPRPRLHPATSRSLTPAGFPISCDQFLSLPLTPPQPFVG